MVWDMDMISCHKIRDIYHNIVVKKEKIEARKKSIRVIFFVHLPSRVDLSGSSALKGSPVQGLIIPAKNNCGEFSYSALKVHTWLPHGRNLTPL